MGFWERNTRNRWLNKVEAIWCFKSLKKKNGFQNGSNVNHIAIPKLRVSSPRFQALSKTDGASEKKRRCEKKEVSEPMDGCGAVWLDPEIPYVFFQRSRVNVTRKMAPFL